MDKSLNAADQRRLLDALEKAKGSRKKMAAKEEEQRWQPSGESADLAGCLAKLTKGELSAIRGHLDIKGASSLKKQELIDLLADKLSAMLPVLLSKMDEARFRILKQVAGRGGRAYLPLEPEQLEYFKQRGLLFTGTYKGNRTLLLPQPLVKSFEAADSPALRETVRRNTEWIQLTQGMLFYYGVLGLAHLESLLKQHTGANLNVTAYLAVMEDALPYYDNMKRTAHGFAHYRVWDENKVLEAHRIRADVPLYPFTKSQLKLASEPEFMERSAAIQAFTGFIKKNYEISADAAEHLVEECVYAIRSGEMPNQVLEFLQSQMDIADLELLKAFMAHIMILHNSTRQWELKGYTPDELSASGSGKAAAPAAKADVIDLTTRKSVGRNDPCPCGSGKKYKKCCG
ncbi:hypothetical protein PAESOLCIP111_05476 [Paenibacillus solanacearum]|uniref:Zinc chelation protein SecC n=1 Tax=Paenibacillus solanacearum TaxID=2048548 RepID=A0A916NL00_9BACL|nr:Rho termination factor N-terminal domain-containing protein [Paenibacillus solanacearum]CAG7647856.1 hypothetical protein PAESOLCIP111_05476 [Paenibacillus solanacearum]